ncbi:MAG: DUF1289 domain-containing protein [Burkholderiaceae bacterium]|nr:DUF1289 domain-containing protein [Burkholderiaceae bacterium]
MNPQDLLVGLAAYVREGEPNVPSPCVSVCRMNPVTQQCEGCLRTLDEISAWRLMDDAGKRSVWRVIEQRLLDGIPVNASMDPGSSPG